MRKREIKENMKRDNDRNTIRVKSKNRRREHKEKNEMREKKEKRVKHKKKSET